MEPKKNPAGFTLIELILAVSVLMMILAVSTPIYTLFQSRNDLDISSDSVAQSLRRAQHYHKRWMVTAHGAYI